MKRVLIVEDSPLISRIYQQKCASAGFQAEVAPDGEAALKMVRGFQPDLVLLDLMLPKVRGLDVLKEIRAHPASSAIPVIVFSNVFVTGDLETLWNAGATQILSKSTHGPNQVLDAVKAALAASEARPTADAPQAKAAPAPLSKPAPQAAPPAAELDEAEFMAQMRKSCLESAAQTMAEARGALKAYEGDARDKAQIHRMCRAMHALSGSSGLAGLQATARLSSATEALLQELHERPAAVNRSTLRTVGQAIEALAMLLDRGGDWPAGETHLANVLVVDDQEIARRVAAFALERAQLRPVCIGDPLVALDLLRENRFDLVFLDVKMPGLDGFELCKKLRALPAHAQTPVVFVTALSAFDLGPQWNWSGGDDVIAKPFMSMEVAVKALSFVLKNRIRQG